MNKNTALIDWDGTIRKGFTIIDWMSFIVKHFNHKNHFLEKVMEEFNRYDYGLLSHDELANITAYYYSKCLEGLKEEDIKKLSDKFILIDVNNFFSFSKGLFSILEKYNIQPIIISGCPIEILNSYKKIINIQNIHGLKIDIKDGIYIDNIIVNSGISNIKEKIVKKELLSNMALVSFGNSISDLPLFKKSKLKFIVNNKKIKISGSAILIEDNDLALFLFDDEIKKRY